MPKRVKITGDLFHPQVPEGAIDVTRQSRNRVGRKYANPHRVGKSCSLDGLLHTVKEAIEAFSDGIDEPREEAIRDDLRGYDLACWCSLNHPCHADVLLEIANDNLDDAPR